MASRSVTLPLESNPLVLRIGKELNKLKAWEESSTSAAETISIGISGIADLYKCICNVLSSPLTQQGLSLSKHENCIHELLEGSLKLLEICCATRHVALQTKEAYRNLRSALISNQQCEASIASYVCSRNKTMKSAKQIIGSLKRAEGDNFRSLRLFVDGGDRVSAVIQALRCISIISVSIYESLLLFLRSKPRCGGKKSLFSKLIPRAKMGSQDEGENGNELENVDFALCGLSSCGGIGNEEKTRLLCKRLEAMEAGMEGIGSGLDSVLRQLTETRVSLLKILSC